MPNQKDIINAHSLIINTFKDFRTELMQHYGKVNYSLKGDKSPVTKFDIKIETKLKSRLSKQFSDFGFKGEETQELPSKNNAVWYVDPIDSTRSFVQGLPYCTNMAGLVINNKIVASVIYNFVTDELFTAFKGQGAFKNGKSIYVKDNKLSDSYVFADAYSYINVYKFYKDSGVKFYTPIGASGYILSNVAQGSIQGACYLKANINHHDVIPGALLIKEAGGKAVSFDKDPFNYKSLKFFMGTKNVCNLTIKQLSKILAEK